MENKKDSRNKREKFMRETGIKIGEKKRREYEDIDKAYTKRRQKEERWRKIGESKNNNKCYGRV